MIQKYIYGLPIETEAIVTDIPATEGSPAIGTITTGDTFTFTMTMTDDEIVFGLGENVRGINKRGWTYTSCCSDQPNHSEEKHSLYGAHNFLLLHNEERSVGLFFDYPGIITFDVGYTRLDTLTVTASDANLKLYVITGDSLSDIVAQFRHAIGRSYVAPRWAFGYGQSRWGYVTKEDFEKVAAGYRDNDLPLDAIYMDIDYMKDYKDFTINQENFPDFPAFVEKMKAQGIRLVPIIDAGVKIEDGYETYEEGVEKGYFCKREDGSDFVAGVWPGRCHFPDFLNKDARDWFGNQYSFLLDQGIEGFWNDMNEPAIFYSDEGLQEMFDAIENFDRSNMGLKETFGLRGMVNSVSNNPKDYERFYHQMGDQKIRHDHVHNLYGYNMTRAAGEAFERIEPDKRILMFSRSSYIGMHRYGGIWTGDNLAWWSHLLLNIQMMPSLNMCGFLYSGADLGGFGSNTTKDLLMRWLAFGLFTPLMRNHAAMGTREKECYQFENVEDFRPLLRLRYRLIPYLYSEYMKASLHDGMMFRPLAFDYPNDKTALHVDDQLMLGDGLMITPVYKQNATGRYVYLPEDMLFIRFTDEEHYICEPMKAGHHFIEVALNEVPMFLRPGHLLPLCPAANCTDQLDLDPAHFTLIANGEAEYTLYTDDGFSRDYENPANYVILKNK